ncbi:MAG TPA: hypothetical protein VFA38_09680 [Nitrospirales bacterium]|nr:hypothetical protein [Nitrospirales bacterium]
MATRDRDWPGFTQWFCCPTCRRLWTSQGKDIVALDPKLALAPAIPSPGVPARLCSICEGGEQSAVAEI